MDLALSPDGSIAYIKNISNLLVVNASTWRCFRPWHSPAVALPCMASPSVRTARMCMPPARATNSTIGRSHQRDLSFSRTISLPGGSDPCGLAISADGLKAYVCLSNANKLAVVNLTSGAVTQQINVGIAPWDVVLSTGRQHRLSFPIGAGVSLGGDLTATFRGNAGGG